MRKSLLLSFLAGALALTSCEQAGKQGEKNEKPAKSGVYAEYMDTLANPGDDFMEFVNGNWIRNTEIPDDKPMYGVAYQVYEASEDNVKSIIEEAASGDFEQGSEQQKLGDLYQSYMDMDSRNALGTSPLEEEFTKIDALKDYEDLAAYFAYAVKYGYEVPLNILIEQDFKHPEIYAAYIEQSGLGLPDREYYLKDDAKSKEIRSLYKDHIKTMFTLAGLPDETKAATTIVGIETRIAQQHLEKEKTRDLAGLYHMMPADSLASLMPRFNWQVFLEETGLRAQEKIGVLMVDYLKALDAIIRNTPVEQWKTYLKWAVINANDTRLNEALDKQHFEFFGRQLYGTSEQRPQWRRAVTVVNSTFGELVGKVYVQKHFPPEAKARMEKLVGNLLSAYELSINELDWMSDATKKEALDKLHKFNTKIGYPDTWKSYDINVAPDDLYGNLRRSDLLEYNRELAKLGQPVDKGEWGLNPQTLNAYYNPTLNEIVFPAAILQPPFFDLEADDAVNYGAIGAIIGHEIGHGFDDKGSTFDGDGALRNWWTDTDRKEFERRTQHLVEQYNLYEVLPGLNLNGEFTQGENIGDLGGLGISLKAYKMSLNGQEAPVIDGYTGIQRVFIGYAQAFRAKFRDEFLRYIVSSDPHSPNKFRVNGVVRNIPEFYTAFGVTEKDSLYTPPEERVKIW